MDARQGLEPQPQSDAEQRRLTPGLEDMEQLDLETANGNGLMTKPPNATPTGQQSARAATRAAKTAADTAIAASQALRLLQRRIRQSFRL